jgi:translation initiation factor 1A
LRDELESDSTVNRVVKIVVVERTRTTTRSVNSPSRKKAKVRSLTRSVTLPPSNPSNHPSIEYAQVLKMLGNGRLEALCFDGSKRLAHIRGKLRKKVWINQGDIILLSLRDYQDEKGDVILKYSADEARSLKAYGELPESAKINETDTYGQEGDGDCNFEFDEDRSESDSDDDGGKGGKEIDIDDI